MNNVFINDNDIIIVGIYLLFFNNCVRSIISKDTKKSCVHLLLAIAYFLLILYYSHHDDPKYKSYKKYGCILISINYFTHVYSNNEVDINILAALGYLGIAFDYYIGTVLLFLYFLLSCVNSLKTTNIKSSFGLAGNFILTVYYGKLL